MKHYTYSLLVSLGLLASACGSGQQRSERISGAPFPYALDNPTHKANLPKSLKEISGISYLPDATLACVQDELGILYRIDPQSGDILATHEFGKKGDYEDLFVVDGIAYILRSDGDIYRFNMAEGGKAEKFETPLKEVHDTEGLAYWTLTGQLLIACKAQSGLEEHEKGHRSIFAFDMATQTLRPWAKISIDELSAIGGRAVSFAPSGIARHPLLGHLYIISSVGKILVVIDENGKVLHLQSLDYSHFMQPEGICFAPDGTLFISNEGKSGKANVLKFGYLTL